MKEQAEIMDRALDTPTVLEHICRDYTDLKDADIEMLRDLAARVESLGRERGADVFIDCLCRDGNEAIVVAEYLREDSPHKFSTIGYIAREENEAGVLRTLHYGIDTREVRAITRAERMVVQTVSPVKRGRATIG
ncbi:MAG: histidine kinase N-terminal domain-containing protein, partial [Firmicutes bacterium]|nr:histidine kinase N-terminal domain-containing protein [Bacillota bacterium]